MQSDMGAPNTLTVGFGEVNITPDPGQRMAGHFYEVLSTGTHDPIKAKAIVLEQGDTKIALGFCDVVSLSPTVSDTVRDEFAKIGEMSRDNVMVSATHSHTGPLFDDARLDFFRGRHLSRGERDPHQTQDFSKILKNGLIQALTLAEERRRPASMSVAGGEQRGLSFNRRYRMRDGTVRFNPGQMNPDIVEPAGPIDPNVDSLLFRSAIMSIPIGALTVFANHCDTVGGTEYSADYPHLLEARLRAAYGSGFSSIFGLGASGDINHIDTSQNGPRKGIEIAYRIGTTLGMTVQHTQRDTSPQQPNLAARQATVELPLQRPAEADIVLAPRRLGFLEQKHRNFKEIVNALKTLDLLERGPKWTTEIQAFRLTDTTALVGLPGEIFTELGLAIKANSPFQHTIVTTLANDRLGYVPTEKAFGEGSYEVDNARIQRGAGEFLVVNALALLEDLARTR